MKFIFIAMTAIGTFAHAKNIPIYVQCDSTGPLYEGLLSLPDQFDGKCVYDKKEDQSEIYQSKQGLTVQFNNLTYVAAVVTYRFFGTTCDLENLKFTAPTSSDLLEIHSGFGGRFYLERHVRLTGVFGTANCRLMEK